MNSSFFFNILEKGNTHLSDEPEKGRVYEIGYPACICPDVASGKVKDVSHCECSRQSISYIIGNLLPDKVISVEIIETV